MEVLIKMPGDFPMQGVLDIGRHLRTIDALVSDCPDPNFHRYSIENYIVTEQLDGIKTILLPDLNVVSCIAQAAKGERLQEDGKNAAAILAFAQCLDILIEPAIAFHEMAFSQGDQAALDKLGWFRVADNGNPHEWVAAGLGEQDRIITVGAPPFIPHIDLAKPLKRWRRNYIVAMKMGELELNGKLNAINKVTTLLEWMRDEFILAGPAATLAFLYFAPNSPPRKGLLKNLRSADREMALGGARNAAWDITYLSDFARRINDGSNECQTRYIFASFDKRLRDLARFVIGEYEELGAAEGLAKSIERWWPAKEAQKIADLWASCQTRIRSPDCWNQYKGQPNYVDEMITQGESFLLDWKNPD